MSHFQISTSKVPIRLFKSDFLEYFTHISPVVVIAIWLPAAVYFLVSSIRSRPVSVSALFIPAGFFIGLFIWTFTEYTLHRFLFHYRPRTPRQEKIFFLFHGVHHAQPQCKTRLVMPPVLSIPMASLAYVLLYLILSSAFGMSLWLAPIFSGFTTGYLIYDLTHYATHHFTMRKGYLRFLKRYHNQHHYKTPDQRFGVSSPLWDAVFGTMPK
jgi:sterol desaturase/sphingolipid hydroxylase (fatty acid hydroxylase superfamily)